MARFNIYTTGPTEEYTISMVKGLCDEFNTLTYDQAMRVCELISQLAANDYENTSSESDLQDEIDDLEDELESARDDANHWETKAERYKSRVQDLENEVEDLKHKIDELKEQLKDK